jgi:hypothetical protein
MSVIKYTAILFLSMIAIDLIIPVNSGQSIIYKIISISIISVYLVIVYLISLIINRSIKARIETFNTPFFTRINDYSFILGFFGALCMFIDKIFVQSIDFSSGIAIAKYQMLEQAEYRTGASSIFSVLSYLLLGFSYWSFVLCLILENRNVKKYLVLNVLLILFCAFLSGGRTNLIILFAFLFSIFSIKKDIYDIRVRIGVRTGLRMLSIALVGIGYILYVFNSRAISNDRELELYAELALEYMNGVPEKNFYSIINLGPHLSNLVFLLLLMVVYLVHSIWVLENVITIDNRYGDTIFVAIKNIMNKFNMAPPPQEWAYAGKFISWPGGLFYETNLAIMLLVAIIHGLGIILCLYNLKRGNKLYIFPTVLLYSVLITSPFIIFVDLLSVPSILLAWFAICIFSIISFRIKIR